MSYEETMAIYKAAMEAAELAAKPLIARGDRGDCGSAAVQIKDARQPFVRHPCAAGIGTAGHPGWILYTGVPGHIQSLYTQEAAARAMASILEDAGLKTHVKIWPD